MPGDDHIARLLPEPPPPRAARRDAAIEAAMRRFDGEATVPIARLARTPAWARLGRTQVAAFASVALVAVVGIPLALTVLEREHRPDAEPAAPVAVVAPKTELAHPAQTPIPGEAPFVTTKTHVVPPARRASPEPEGVPAPVIVPEDCGKGDCERLEAPASSSGFTAAKPVAVSAPAPEPSHDIAVTAHRSAPAAASSAYTKMADASDGETVVVTGSRVAQPNAARIVAMRRRGDWNACTVNDPGKTLAGCGRLIDRGARGAAGQAAAHVADGLSRAWNGDLDGAIGEFDAAIALQPRLAIAYLNRGLAYQRRGDTGRALSDLNRAVRYAPSAARGYFSRSQLLDETGDAARARTDADRALTIDPAYRAVLE